MRLCPLILTLSLCACTTIAPAPERSAPMRESAMQTIPQLDNDWYRAAADKLAAATAAMPADTRARNVILFVGDGMSLATVTAARILEGQLRGESGEENLLSFEHFPFTGLSKTYNTNAQVPDSAGTASAMLTGVKTRIGVLGVDASARYDDCSSFAGSSVPTLLEHAERAGLATGVVTTTRITHATPASTYAHTPNRSWETDTEENIGACTDIARQLVEFAIGDGPEVLLGGGRSALRPQNRADPEHPDESGWRGDGRDLIVEWTQRNAGGQYVWNKRQFDNVDPTRTTKLLGLFEPADMQFESDRNDGMDGEPSLAEMVEKAIAILQRNAGGFFLLVEGGRIDHAHHYGNAYRALHDTIAFSEAVRVAQQHTNGDDTLIIVTADHGHVMEIAGYPTRGNPILGKVIAAGGDYEGQYARDAAGMPYTTLVYGNGPGHTAATDLQAEGTKTMPHEYETFVGTTGNRPDLTHIDTANPDFLQEAAIPMMWETHSGTDVPIYATGPGSWLLTGVHEQNYIFHVMANALFQAR